MKSYGVTIHETSLAALLHGAINLVGFYKRDFSVDVWGICVDLLLSGVNGFKALSVGGGGGGVL